MPAQKFELRLKIAGAFNHADSLLQLRSHWDMVDGKPSTYTPSTHAHGALANDGVVGTEVTYDGANDRILIADASDSYKIKRVPVGALPLVGHTHDDRYYTETEIQNNQILMRDMRVNPNGAPSSNLGSPSVAEMALFQEQFNNKTEFYNIAKIKFYTSTDNVNWTEITTFTDASKRIFVGGDGTTTGITIPNNTPFFRIEIENDGNYVYLNALYMYWQSSGHSSKVRIWQKPRNTQVWGIVTNSNSSVSSWPGHLYLPFPTIPFHPTGTTHADAIRIEFENTWNLNSTTNPSGWNLPIYLHKMQIWGGYPAGKRTIYSVNEYKDVNFPSLLREMGQRVYSPNNKPSLSDLGINALISTSESFTTGDLLMRKTLGAGALEKTTLAELKSFIIGEASTDAYRGDRGKIAYDHSQASGNPHGATLDNIADGSTRKLADYVPTTRTIAGLQLNANITVASLTAALNEASTSLKGLMSSTDKTNLDTLVALLASSDGDTVVNTIAEILAIFNNYPEGADLVTALNGKVDKITGYGLSKNDFTDAWKTKLEGISTGAEVNPDIMSESEGTTGTFTTKRTINALTLKAIILAHSPAGSRPASDVYSWAKASVKPTYTKSEVGLANADNTADNAKYVLGLLEQRASTQTKIWTGSQAQYDAIGTKDSNTLYFIQA